MPDLFLDKDGDGKNDLEIKPMVSKKVNKPIPPASRSKDVVDDELSLPLKVKEMNPLSIFARYPKGIRFESQTDDEEIVLFLRQHPIVNVPWIIISVILLIVPIIIFPYFFPLLSDLFPLTPTINFIITFFYYVIVFGYSLVNFLGWYFNVYIVTNERIFDLDFINILSHEVSTGLLVNIQDVTLRSKGVAGSVFDYGTIVIQTEAVEVNFDFESVPHPAIVVNTIEDLIEKARKKEGTRNL